ncbi:MAG: glycosyltransferase family 2 protein [Gemmatimonadales bacterium]
MSAEATPLVSVIVAAKNEARHIGQCLESLFAQSWPRLEVIVVDDGSTDATPEVAARFAGVRLLRQRPSGKATAINAAAKVAQGEILLFLDGDMYFDRRYVEVLAAPIASGACMGSSHGTEHVANPENRWSRCLQARFGLPPDRRQALTPQQIASGSTVFRAIRKADYLRVGGFDEIGFMDDQTLFPKLNVRARLLEDAICWHYNLETLGEAFASGRWAARSILHLHGRKALVTYLPVFSLVRAVREGFRHRMAAMVPFVTAYELGVFAGLLG